MPVPSASDLVKQVKGHVQKGLDKIKLVLGTVTGYTGGTSISVKFPEDSVASTTGYQVLLGYAAVKPQVGDKVLIGQVQAADGSSEAVILGAIGPPPATTSQAMPTGAVIDFAGSSSPPSGWLACDGSAVSRTTYADLFAVVGTTYGAGDGSTTFNVPDCAGRVTVGVGDPTAASGHTNHTLAQKSGEETHVLTTGEMPSHSHGYSSATLSVSAGALGSVHNDSGTGIQTSSVGSGTAHNNMMPYMVFNKIIKT